MEDKKQKEIKVIYEQYLTKLNELKKEQQKIIDDFIQEIEKRKIEKIKKEL